MTSLDPLGSIPRELHDRLAGVRFLVLDVDGTLTDGRVTTLEEGGERFDVHDGQGLVWLQRKAEVHVAWITGRGSITVQQRARELQIDHLEVKSGPKAEVVSRLQASLRLTPEMTLAMGDDLPDLVMAERAALFVAPADACEAVRAKADLVTTADAGRGAVREVCEWILAAKGLWRGLLDSYGA